MTRLRGPLEGRVEVQAPFGPIPLVDWGPDLLAKFRANVLLEAAKAQTGIEDWLAQELGYLSPYLLPYPLSVMKDSSYLRQLEERGFSSVIRLPLKSSAARDLARKKLETLDNACLLFLDRACGTARPAVRCRCTCRVACECPCPVRRCLQGGFAIASVTS
jgi:hypothetical protein